MGNLAAIVKVNGRHDYELNRRTGIMDNYEGEFGYKSFDVIVKYRTIDERGTESDEYVGKVSGFVVMDESDFFATMDGESEALYKLSEAIMDYSCSHIKDKYLNEKYRDAGLVVISDIRLPHTFKDIDVLEQVFNCLPYLIARDICSNDETYGFYVSAYDDLTGKEFEYESKTCKDATRKIYTALGTCGYEKVKGHTYVYNWTERRTHYRWR